MTVREELIAETEPHVIRPAVSSANQPSESGGENVVDLLRQLIGQGSHLAEQQLQLVKAEVREAANDTKTAVGAMVGAAVVGIGGLGVTLMGLAYLLAQAIDNLGVATLIVGVATLVLAYVLYRGAAKKMSATHFAPERTERTLSRTPDIARGDLHSEQTR
jgi:hypothetical protein